MKIDPILLYIIYTYGDCTGLFLDEKKNPDFYKDCRGFWVKKNALLEPKINFLIIFSMDLDLIQLLSVIWALKTVVLSKIDQNWSKNSKKTLKIDQKMVFFQFSRVPPWQNAKNRFSNMKSPLKMAKTSGSFNDFDEFFDFRGQNAIFDQKMVKMIKNPEEILPPPFKSMS